LPIENIGFLISNAKAQMSNETPMSKKKEVNSGMKEKRMNYYERNQSEKHKELLGPKFTLFNFRAFEFSPTAP
jgi:hypothetical protein